MRGQANAGQASDQNALIQENRRLTRENEEQRGRIHVLETLLAVISTFAKLPLPVKDDWQDFYRAAALRLNRIVHMTTGPLEVPPTAQIRFWEAAATYRANPGALPKPAADVDAAAEDEGGYQGRG